MVKRYRQESVFFRLITACYFSQATSDTTRRATDLRVERPVFSGSENDKDQPFGS